MAERSPPQPSNAGVDGRDHVSDGDEVRPSTSIGVSCWVTWPSTGGSGRRRLSRPAAGWQGIGVSVTGGGGDVGSE